MLDAIAKKALSLVKKEEVIGLGTGKAAFAFTRALAKLKWGGRVVASSKETEALAKSLNLSLVDLNEVLYIDKTFDGADQVDRKMRLIKGRGGALLREKILAAASKEVIILIEEKKLAPLLGKIKLPVEITPFGAFSTKRLVEEIGFSGAFRKEGESFFVTDNGNFILDLDLSEELFSPEECHLSLKAIPGVVETGLFLKYATSVIVGYAKDRVEILS